MIDEEDRTFLARGAVQLTGRSQGIEVLRWGGDNLVVSSSRDVLARLAAGLGEAKVIKYVGFGTGATPASPDDIGLTDPIYVQLGAPTFPSVGEVRFPWVLPEATANGMIIREMGLFSADMTLFARKVRLQPILKTDLSSEGEWSIWF